MSAKLDQGIAEALRYEDASFDRVLSSFMFHHLESDQKEQALREVRRVLKSGGSFHMLDFSKPESSGAGVVARWLHSSHHLAENTEGRILGLMNQAGLEGARVVSRGSMFFYCLLSSGCELMAGCEQAWVVRNLRVAAKINSRAIACSRCGHRRICSKSYAKSPRHSRPSRQAIGSQVG